MSPFPVRVAPTVHEGATVMRMDTKTNTAHPTSIAAERAADRAATARVITIDLPVKFYDDHVGRDLPHGLTINWMRNTVRVRITPAALADVLDDARHYVELGVAALGPEHAGLVSSARATVRRIEAAGVLS